MQGNERAKGDAFAPIKYIESFHQAWVADGVARWSSIGYRALNLFFWPGVALFTLSPLIAWFGGRGMVRIWRQRPEYRWLIWVVLVPTAYFTFRAVVLLNFVPLGRFAVTQVALLLPFVGVGYLATVEAARPRRGGCGPVPRSGWRCSSRWCSASSPLTGTTSWPPRSVR